MTKALASYGHDCKTASRLRERVYTHPQPLVTRIDTSEVKIKTGHIRGTVPSLKDGIHSKEFHGDLSMGRPKHSVLIDAETVPNVPRGTYGSTGRYRQSNRLLRKAVNIRERREIDPELHLT